jgi:hypothetical protein
LIWVVSEEVVSVTLAEEVVESLVRAENMAEKGRNSCKPGIGERKGSPKDQKPKK